MCLRKGVKRNCLVIDTESQTWLTSSLKVEPENVMFLYVHLYLRPFAFWSSVCVQSVALQ